MRTTKGAATRTTPTPSRRSSGLRRLRPRLPAATRLRAGLVATPTAACAARPSNPHAGGAAGLPPLPSPHGVPAPERGLDKRRPSVPLPQAPPRRRWAGRTRRARQSLRSERRRRPTAECCQRPGRGERLAGTEPTAPARPPALRPTRQGRLRLARSLRRRTFIRTRCSRLFAAKLTLPRRMRLPPGRCARQWRRRSGGWR
mmetsp:Transcript_9460/g.36943  ORF Transcript_9460/g.36943 Transcript_9460/m.36943 type:complete len:201 (+) Transcript_9460:1393-1995(+)